jgi:hypothetical protein
LAWDLVFPVQATGQNGWLQGNALCQLDRFTITTQSSNQILVDIPQFNRYVSMLTPVMTTQEELQIKASPSSSNNTAVVTASTGQGDNSIVPSLYGSAAVASLYPFDNVSICNAGNNVDGLSKDAGRPFGNCIRKLYTVGGVSGTATAGNASFSLDLNSIPASICDLDKLLYFSGESLVISIYWAPVNRFAFGSTSTKDPVATAAIAPTGTFTINNPTIYLYVEQNIDIISSLTSTVMNQGISIPFAYSFIQRQTATSGSFSVTSQLSRGYGSKLLFAAVSLFHPTEVNNTAQDHSVQSLITNNNGNYSVMNFNSLLNNIPIMTNNNISLIGSTQNGEHWLYNKAKLYNSCINNLSTFNTDFVHIDSFIGSDSLCNSDLSVEDGLELASNQVYSFVVNGTSANAVTHNIYLIFACQKTLNLSPAGVQIS